MLANIITPIILVSIISIFVLIYRNKYNGQNTVANKTANQVSLDEIYSKLSDEQLIMIGMKNPLTPEEQDVIDYENELETIKNNPVYSKMSKEQLEMIGIICLTPKERAEKRKVREKAQKELNDFFYETTYNPKYSFMPGNVGYNIKK